VARDVRPVNRLRHWLLVPVLLLAAACAPLPARPALPTEVAVPVADSDGPIDEMVAQAEARHPGQSGFRLVSDGREAFALRHLSARLAVRSIDVQTYIWHDDLTGRVLATALLDAAERGVKVRLLLDDMDARAKQYVMAALDTHPNIEIRVFNPLASRSGTLSMAFEFLGNFGRLNHRMHNKSWIVDNRLAVVGGRNLGDEYFSASDEVNFVDLDFAMIGPVVRDVSASFDRFWNSAAAYPVALLQQDAPDAADLQALKDRFGPAYEEARQGAYAESLQQDDAIRRMTSGDWPMTWTAEYRFVSDEPLKAKQEESIQRSAVAVALRDAMLETERRLSIISPYFVPGESATDALAGMAQAGKQVGILTNSLAANDVAAVHGGYSRYRKKLLKGGVSLWELKPEGGAAIDSSLFGSSGASLHTKALCIDGEVLFVGSFNLDPRSAMLNTEQGVLVRSPELSREFEASFELKTSPQAAWRVRLVDGDLRWSDGEEEFEDEPLASAGRRFQAWFARVFPIESQL
jgi:putative cardiolipin synthase